MKSGGPWNLRGLQPEAREAARKAARRSGVSVGEWLNNVIQPDDAEFDAPDMFDNVDDQPAYEQPRYSRRDDRRREQPEPRRQLSDWDDGRPEPRRHRSDRDDERVESRRHRSDRDSNRVPAEARRDLNEVHSRLDKLSKQLERLGQAESQAGAHDRRAPQRRPAPQQRPAAQPNTGRIAQRNDDRIPPRDSGQTRLTGAPTRNRAGAGASIDDALAEISARQRALDGEPAKSAAQAPSLAPNHPVQEAPAPASQVSDNALDNAFHDMPAHDLPAHDLLVQGLPVHESTINFSNLEQQLRDITGRIEALQPSAELEASVAAIRADLGDIANLITGALPRREVESLESEVKALADRIEHTRQCGVDTSAIAGLERGLAEVHEALNHLTPAESLVGFDEAVRALSQKVDMIVAKDDPAALEQLETAIGALRGIVSHVASDETLTKVAEDVRELAVKVDSLAATAATNQSLAALEQRIESLANALNASANAGQSVPQELEKLLTGLIEKLEWVQLTHTDHAVMAHLEDRIATLVQRFDASDQRLVHLEAVERGMADLLVHIEQLRSSNILGGAQPAPAAPAPAEAIQRDVAAIRQSELRTRDSLEAVHGTVEHVVDRLAAIESGIRETAAPPAPAELPPAPQLTAPPLQPSFAQPPMAEAAPAPMSGTAPHAVLEAMEAASTLAADFAPAQQRAAAARNPIDPDLPPDHPLEPGSAVGRRPTASAADRIAASEAAVNAAKPPVIDDSGNKPNFIAAARRAAQAASWKPDGKSDGKSEEKPEPKAAAKNVVQRGSVKAVVQDAKPKQPRSRKLVVAGAAALIVIGFLHIASRFFESNPAPDTAPATAPQQEQVAPAPSPAPAEPPAAALPQPEPQAPAAEPAPLPVPSAPQNPSAAPAAPLPKSSAIIPTTKPVQQTAQQTAPINLTPDTDVTGTLPHAAAAPAAPASAPIGDKLPATIGGPALRAAALNGDAAAAYEVATRFADGHGVPANNAQAALWFERAARQGLAPAEFRLGSLYEKGLGVKKDLATARDLYLAAAKKGNGKAMHNLAVLYAEGIEGSPDYANAGHWFHEAADRGITDSQYNLGILYARGIGVTQNFAESYKWFALAAREGDQDAAKKRDEVASHLDAQSLQAAELAVKTWTAKPQPEDAVAVKAPAGGWDVTQINAPAKPKPHAAVVSQPANVKVN